MIDIILETLLALVAGMLVLALIQGKLFSREHNVEGWNKVMLGFGLLFFAAAIDITDNFPILNRLYFIGDTPAQAFLEKVVGSLMGLVFIFLGVRQWLPNLIEHQEMLNERIRATKKQVEHLHGLLPICTSCKKVRDDQGYWNQIESYITLHSEAAVAHSYCPECAEKLHPDELRHVMDKKDEQGPEDSQGD